MIEKYTHKKHRHLIESWLSARIMPVPDPQLFYDIGFVVDSVAIGFLCKTNSKLASIEQIVTKPSIPREVREPALQVLFKRIEHEARLSGFWILSALAVSDNMRNRFAAAGLAARAGSYDLVYKIIHAPDTEVFSCLS